MLYNPWIYEGFVLAMITLTLLAFAIVGSIYIRVGKERKRRFWWFGLGVAFLLGMVASLFSLLSPMTFDYTQTVMANRNTLLLIGFSLSFILCIGCFLAGIVHIYRKSLH